MLIRQLHLRELEAAYLIDKEANSTSWSLQNYQDSLLEVNHYILGLFNKEIKLIAVIVYAKIITDVEILQFVVAKPAQNQGWASYLLEHSLILLKQQNIENVFLEVRCDNSVAIHLYHKFKFNQVGLRKNYYKFNGKCVDALLMAKLL